MRIELNGESHDCSQAITLSELLSQRGLTDRRVAVEVNQAIVPRGQHSSTALAEGDRVEIIHAMGGG